jgi:hypothetical protein
VLCEEHILLLLRARHSCFLEVLLVYATKCLALMRRASVVFTCDRDLTGRRLLALALAQIWRHAYYSTDDIKVRSRHDDVGRDEQISSYLSLPLLENMSH